MKKHYLLFLLLLVNSFSHFSLAQNFTNKGKDFWLVSYYRQSQTSGVDTTRSMVIYLATGDSAAVVSIELDSSGSVIPNTSWKRTYTIPAHTAISIADPMPNGVSVTHQPACIGAVGPLPQGRANECGYNMGQLICTTCGTEPIYRKTGIHITSTTPIAAYAHTYGIVAANATVLFPTESWGYEYTGVNSSLYNQPSATGTWMYIIACHDSTTIEITPSTILGNGRPANVPYTVSLQKGQIFRILGKVVSTNTADLLTGTKVRSVFDSLGHRYPVAVFCGTGFTGGEAPCNNAGRDPDFNQAIPEAAWGQKYITTPYVQSASFSVPLLSVFKVIVKDTTTIVKRNGVVLTGRTANNYYRFTSSNADFIEANRPVLVVQYMTVSCSSNLYDGDPEMTYLTPVENAVKKSIFYRNNKESINDQYVTLAIPTNGIATLKIDGLSFANMPANYKYRYPHPYLSDYTIVIRKWPSAKAQCTVESTEPFTGLAYGLGSSESYVHVLGNQFDLSNLTYARYNRIRGKTFIDYNSNGLQEPGEPLFNQAKVSLQKAGNPANIYTSSSSGSFIVYADTGTYQTTAIPYFPYFTISPAVHTTAFSSYGNEDTAVFAAVPIPGKRDVSIHLLATGRARLVHDLDYKILYENNGTDTAHGSVEFIKSPMLGLQGTTPAPTVIVGDTLRWNFNDLLPANTKQIDLHFSSLVFFNVGDILLSTATITSDKPDLTPIDTVSTLWQRVVGSADPNDKTENHGGSIAITKVASGEYLQYMIRFQNTGTDTAFRVVVKDTLDSKVDWSSLRMVCASHNYQLTVTGGNHCSWSFDNINLPDSNVNESQSHGYLVFMIKPKPTLGIGNVISNRASIYFDENAPVTTNTETTTVVADALPLKLLSFTAKKNGKTNLLNWTTAQEINVDRFEVERRFDPNSAVGTGDRGFIKIKSEKAKAKSGENEYEYTDNIGGQSSVAGRLYYRLKMIDKDGQFTYSPIRQLTTNNSPLTISIYPNPAKDNLQVQIDSDKKTTLQMQILSLDGKVMLSNSFSAAEGSSLRSINISTLSKGSYFLKVFSLNPPKADGEAQVMKFEKL